MNKIIDICGQRKTVNSKYIYQLKMFICQLLLCKHRNGLDKEGTPQTQNRFNFIGPFELEVNLKYFFTEKQVKDTDLEVDILQ